MQSKSKSKYFLIAIAFVFLALLTWFLKTIVIYLIVSIVLSLIGHPLVQFYSKIKVFKKHIPNTIASVLALFTMIGVIALLVSLFIPLIVQEARIIHNINPNEVVTAFKQPLHNLEY